MVSGPFARPLALPTLEEASTRPPVTVSGARAFMIAFLLDVLAEAARQHMVMPDHDPGCECEKFFEVAGGEAARLWVALTD